jgi:hypothetical protein
VIVGKLHVVKLPESHGTLQISGLVIGEDHHDSQQGQLLLTETLTRLHEHGDRCVIAVTASPRAQNLFARLGGVPGTTTAWQVSLLNKAGERYAPAEREALQLFQFALGAGLPTPP